METFQCFKLLRYVRLLIFVDRGELCLLLLHFFLPLDELADQYTDLTILRQVGHLSLLRVKILESCLGLDLRKHVLDFQIQPFTLLV